MEAEIVAGETGVLVVALRRADLEGYSTDLARLIKRRHGLLRARQPEPRPSWIGGSNGRADLTRSSLSEKLQKAVCALDVRDV